MMRFSNKLVEFTLMSLIVLFLIGCEKQPTDVVVCDCAPAQWYGYPTWSPTGEWIAYYYSGPEGLQPWGSRGLWLIRPDGSDKQFLTEGVTCDFSPDGKMIALQYGEQIFVYDLETKTRAQLALEGFNYNPSWSPDGRKIAYSGGVLVLNLRRINDQNEIEIASHKKTTLGDPDWFPDFRILQSRATTRNRESTVDLFIIDTTATVLHQLTDSGTSNLGAKVSPDGSKIIWQRYEEGRDSNDIAVWIMNADGSGKVRLTAGWEPAWAPDGRHIIFRKEGEFIPGQSWNEDDPKVHGSLWIMDVTTRAARQFLPPK